MNPISSRHARPNAADPAALAAQKRRARDAREEEVRAEDAALAARRSRASPPMIGLSNGSVAGSESARNPEEILRRQLLDRAGQLDLSPLMGQKAGAPGASPTPASRGSRGAERASESGDALPRERTPEEPLPLLGEGRTLEDSDSGRVRAEAPVRPAPRALPSEVQRQQTQRSERQRVERADDPRSLESLSTLGPQAGSAPPREATRESSGSASRGSSSERLPGEDLAREDLTQAGLVEAQMSRDLFARFLAGTPERDPGPVPRTREVLGIRSRPISVKV